LSKKSSSLMALKLDGISKLSATILSRTGRWWHRWEGLNGARARAYKVMIDRARQKARHC
jgi:hypothetical protein